MKAIASTFARTGTLVRLRRRDALRDPRRTASTRGVRGVTLFEVLIVVAILAMVAGGVAAFALPKFREAQKQQAETGARVVRTAIQQWQAANNEISCPTISQLVQEKHLDPGQSTNDPWAQPYTLNCADEEVAVISPGPDKRKGTADDIAVPKGATSTGPEAQ
ncbi:MAG TPA: type II secretion system protein [Polyangiaceae bacterium]|nr:type II secretion system protein [Polyangiaceae bacterium]